VGYGPTISDVIRFKVNKSMPSSMRATNNKGPNKIALDHARRSDKSFSWNPRNTRGGFPRRGQLANVGSQGADQNLKTFPLITL